MIFDYVKDRVESALSRNGECCAVSHSKEISSSSNGYVFRFLAHRGSYVDDLVVKFARHLGNEAIADEKLKALGLTVVEHVALLPQAYNGLDMRIMQPARGITLRKLFDRDPERAIRFLVDAFYEFHQVAFPHGWAHKDLAMRNILVDVENNAPVFTFLDNGWVESGNAWGDAVVGAENLLPATRRRFPNQAKELFGYFLVLLEEGSRREDLPAGLREHMEAAFEREVIFRQDGQGVRLGSMTLAARLHDLATQHLGRALSVPQRGDSWL